MHTRSLRTLAVVLVAGVMVTACGDGDEATDTDDGDVAAVTEPADATSEATDTTSAAADDEASANTIDDGAAATDGTGFVEIGGTRYDLAVYGCIDLAGALGGRFEGADNPDNIKGNFSFSPDDWESRDSSEGWTEAGAVTLRVEDPYLQWETGVSLVEGYNLPDGMSADEIVVTSFEIDEDALAVQGQATFIEVNSLMAGSATEPTAGTFEFDCPTG